MNNMIIIAYVPYGHVILKGDSEHDIMKVVDTIFTSNVYRLRNDASGRQSSDALTRMELVITPNRRHEVVEYLIKHQIKHAVLEAW